MKKQHKKLLIFTSLCIVIISIVLHHYVFLYEKPLKTPLTAKEAYEKIINKYFVGNESIVLSDYRETYYETEQIKNAIPIYDFRFVYFSDSSQRWKSRGFSVNSLTGKIKAFKSQRTGDPFLNGIINISFPEYTYDIDSALKLIDQKIGFSIIEATFESYDDVALICHTPNDELYLQFIGRINDSVRIQNIIVFYINQITNEITYTESHLKIGGVGSS